MEIGERKIERNSVILKLYTNILQKIYNSSLKNKMGFFIPL
jgi:hypothetical protein